MDLKAQSPDLDTIRNRVTELKTRLGSLQMEIRDYNQQMEQKVNLLMQILQTSSTPQGAMQLQQQLARMQPPQMPNMMNSRPNSYGMDAASGMGNSFPTPLASTHTDFLGRRDSLLASLGHQSTMGGGGLSGLAGLPGLGMSGLGAGGLGGLGGSLGSLGGFGGLGGLGAVGQKNGTDGGVGGVAGLQHLLEAAQRYQTEDTKGDANGHEGRAAKRFCTEASQLGSARSEETRA